MIYKGEAASAIQIFSGEKIGGRTLKVSEARRRNYCPV
jgi:hypothetical protein